MPKPVNVAIFGTGNIGKHLASEVKKLGWNLVWVANRSGLYAAEPNGHPIRFANLDECSKHLGKINLAFVAIPTLDDGRAAYDIIATCLDEEILVVTCEKGALSAYPDLWEQPNFSQLGINATVGGGTGIPKFAFQNNYDFRHAWAVVNGTLNFLLDAMHRLHLNPEDAVRRAIAGGFVEPGETDLISIINGEAIGDVSKKAAILWRLLRPTLGHIAPSDFETFPLGEGEVANVVRNASSLRYLVSIGRGKYERKGIGGFYLFRDGWTIQAGFRTAYEIPGLGQLGQLQGVGNGIIIERDGIDPVRQFGLGAGPEPTVSSMLNDAGRLLAQRLAAAS